MLHLLRTALLIYWVPLLLFCVFGTLTLAPRRTFRIFLPTNCRNQPTTPALRRPKLEDSCSLGFSPLLFLIPTQRLAGDYLFQAPYRLSRLIPASCCKLVQRLGDVPLFYYHSGVLPILSKTLASRHLFSKKLGVALWLRLSILLHVGLVAGFLPWLVSRRNLLVKIWRLFDHRPTGNDTRLNFTSDFNINSWANSSTLQSCAAFSLKSLCMYPLCSSSWFDAAPTSTFLQLISKDTPI